MKKPMPDSPINPQNAVCVLRHEGKEVGRIAATAANQTEYINELTRYYKTLDIDIEENADYAMVSRMLSKPR